MRMNFQSNQTFSNLQLALTMNFTTEYHSTNTKHFSQCSAHKHYVRKARKSTFDKLHWDVYPARIIEVYCMLSICSIFIDLSCNWFCLPSRSFCFAVFQIFSESIWTRSLFEISTKKSLQSEWTGYCNTQSATPIRAFRTPRIMCSV